MNKIKIDDSKSKELLRYFVFIFIIVIALTAIYLSTIHNNNEEKTNYVVSNQYIENNVNEVRDDIPENETVVVSFVDDFNNRSYEYRRITNRERILSYAISNDEKVREDLTANNSGTVYDAISGWFYFEGDVEIQGKKMTYADFGSVIVSNYVKNNGDGFDYTTIVTIWTASSDISNDYYEVYVKNYDKDTQPQNAISVMNYDVINILRDFYFRSLKDMKISNIRIGLIENNKNSWINEYTINQDNENTEFSDDVNNSNIYEDVDEYTDRYNTSDSIETYSSSDTSREQTENQSGDNTIEEQRDTTFEMLSLEVTSSPTTTTSYYTLMGKVNVKCGRDVDWSKYRKFTATINGEKASCTGDTITNGFMSFYKTYNFLDKGKNEFEIIVTDADGKSISETYTVTYEAAED